MNNSSKIEEYYNFYVNNLNYLIPDGIYEVNLDLLKNFDLLHFKYPENRNAMLTGYFQVIESKEKITLFNEEFIVWIIPKRIHDVPTTHTLVAIINEAVPKLELAFITTGVYNSSMIVLKILEKFLIEIKENETLLNQIKKVN